MVTFIITLVVTALISVVLTRLCYKYRYELKQKEAKSNDSKNAKNSPFYATATNKMDTTIMCENDSTSKTVTNPIYVSTGL